MNSWVQDLKKKNYFLVHVGDARWNFFFLHFKMLKHFYYFKFVTRLRDYIVMNVLVKVIRLKYRECEDETRVFLYDYKFNKQMFLLLYLRFGVEVS